MLDLEYCPVDTRWPAVPHLLKTIPIFDHDCAASPNTSFTRLFLLTILPRVSSWDTRKLTSSKKTPPGLKTHSCPWHSSAARPAGLSSPAGSCSLPVYPWARGACPWRPMSFLPCRSAHVQDRERLRRLLSGPIARTGGRRPRLRRLGD